MSILAREQASFLTLTASERLDAAKALAARMCDARMDTTTIDGYITALTAHQHPRGR
jgi:hypothetical protein